MFVSEYKDNYFNDVARLLADFRVTLNSFKGNKSEPDLDAAKEELKFHLNNKFPLYVTIKDNKVVGYILLRVDGVVWVEHIYVDKSHRREGIASLLFAKAEEYSNNLHEDTLFNYVHPNNDAMISFLKSKGYSVLNLIEIRKPYKDEQPTKRIKVGNHEFDY